jgi:hypothetical protein
MSLNERTLTSIEVLWRLVGDLLVTDPGGAVPCMDLCFKMKSVF